MQFQADMLLGKVVRSNFEELSVLGATFLAGLTVGFFDDLDDIERLRKAERIFEPTKAQMEIGPLYSGWKYVNQNA